MAEFDLVIRGGSVVDGTGSEPFAADIGIRNGKIAAVGQGLGQGREEVDATGKLVTPGFIDIHTHYDGQVTWEHRLSPSSGHGVTTVVMGNCGVGFAPCKPEQRDMLIELMEGVEDIPGIVMVEGLPWNWETFPEYLDALDARHYDIDIAAQLPHSPLRVYVMGDRAPTGVATGDDLARMKALTTEALKAGALGVTTSRSPDHRSMDGEVAPSVRTAETELLAIAEGLRDAGHGVFQIIGDPHGEPPENFATMRRLAETAKRPVSFTLLHGSRYQGAWPTYLEGLEAANDAGLEMRGQVFPRPVGLLYGLDLTFNPFSLNPSYGPIADLPLKEKVKALRDPAMRARLLAEQPEHSNSNLIMMVEQAKRAFRMGNPPVYEPAESDGLPAIAERRGVSLAEAAYDLLLEDEGRAILYVPFSNYNDNSIAVPRALMAHEHTILGLGDGGAHYGMICDASYTTYVLTRWVRDATPADAFSLPWAVKAMTHDPARAVGLTDRGLIAEGMKADLNVIDYEGLTLHAPRTVRDLPAGGRRLSQQADGYAVTIVGGQITYRDGRPTGALPGRLVRGPIH